MSDVENNNNKLAMNPQQSFSLAPRNLTEAMEFAKLIASSDLAPKDYKGKAANIVVAVAMGADLGLSPMQALQSIAVINGRPSVWGDGQLAICRSHRDFENIAEVVEGQGDERVAVCTVKRRGQSETVSRFSVKDAKTAGLWGTNVWARYPDRMLQNRARGFALRDSFADALKGIISAEEAEDIAFHESQRKPVRIIASPEVTIVDAVENSEIYEKAMDSINTAESIEELKAVGEWIKGAALSDEHIKDVRDHFISKQQSLNAQKIDEAKERLRRTKERMAQQEASEINEDQELEDARTEGL